MGREEASVGSNEEDEVSHGVGRIRESSKERGEVENMYCLGVVQTMYVEGKKVVTKDQNGVLEIWGLRGVWKGGRAMDQQVKGRRWVEASIVQNKALGKMRKHWRS